MNNLVVLGLLTFICCVSNNLVNSDVIVSTSYGDVRGMLGNTSRYFLGIPFANPPVGSNRWVSPSQPSPWKPDVYNATEYKPSCPQKYCYKFLPNASCPVETSEDCLYLNIWTPLNANATSGLPVMVFIHGGAFKWGSGNIQVYHGENLAKFGDVIVVDTDYRIGLLGYLYTGDDDNDAHGNFGLQDQRLALQWVQQNIRNFGGDPAKVILFGQSAGAQSTYAHMMSRRSEGLFRGVIVESAPFAVPYRTKGEALVIASEVKRIARCEIGDVMECLRSRTADEINDIQQKLTFRITGTKIDEYFESIGPIIDGNDVSSQPMTAAAKGYFQKIPIMVGTVSEEGRLFVYGVWKLTLTKTEYELALEGLHPGHSEAINKLYPPKPEVKDFRDYLSLIVTDSLFYCATRNASINIVQNNDANVFSYMFDHATVAHGSWGKDSFCEGHVCHAEELGYIFGNHLAGKPTTDEVVLSETLMIYWTNFAHSLDPNIGKYSPAITWPAFRPNSTRILHFETPENNILENYREEYCDVWDAIGYDQVLR